MPRRVTKKAQRNVPGTCSDCGAACRGYWCPACWGALVSRMRREQGGWPEELRDPALLAREREARDCAEG